MIYNIADHIHLIEHIANPRQVSKNKCRSKLLYIIVLKMLWSYFIDEQIVFLTGHNSTVKIIGKNSALFQFIL